nr:RNA-binding protein 39 isoform X1 [Ipomoea batatas]
MDFDEYEYLERTVEDPESQNLKEIEQGGEDNIESKETDGKKVSQHKLYDSDDELEYRSKHSRSVDVSRDHNKKRRSAQYSSSIENIDKNRHRSNREHGDREGDRKDRDRRARDRVHGREKRGERERESLNRSRTYSERHRDRRGRARSPDRGMSKDREYKEKNTGSELKERDRQGRRYREKKEEASEQEVDPERDQRTVFAYQLSLKADEKDVYEFFCKAGKGKVAGGARKLYVGNLHFSLKEDQLHQVFEPFGDIELVHMPIDSVTGLCKGFGFVQFARLEDARAATSLDGKLEIAGQVIKLLQIKLEWQMLGSNAADLDGDEAGGLSLDAHSRALLMRKLDHTGTTMSISGVVDLLNGPDPPPSASNLGLFPAGSLLIPPLAQAPISAVAELPSSVASIPAVTLSMIIGVPSECLLLKNMFDPKLEREPNFDLDIKEDVEDECLKFGTLKHIYVDKNSSGFVYLRFENTQAAMNAQRALHGRWFAGKMITATYMDLQNYEAKFPESR